MPLGRALSAAAQAHDKLRPKAETGAAVLAFVADRVKGALLEAGFRYDLVDAAIAAGGDDILDWKRRLEALVQLSKEEKFADLVELVERTFNISKALDDPKSGLGGRQPVRADLPGEAPELVTLAAALEGVRARFLAACDARDYAGAARTYLDALGAPVHEFFAKVYVNVEEKDLRVNRLSLLREIHELFARRIGDLTKVVEGKK
jgi:glycyl-tRNA synthetase beta chain